MLLALGAREAIHALSPALEAELDRICATMSNTFEVEHDDQGRHTNIHPTSITNVVNNSQNSVQTAQGGSQSPASIAAEAAAIIDAELLVNAGGGGGGGDVVGPAGAVDSRIALFDGVTGKLIKDSGSTVASVISTAILSGYLLQSSVIMTEADIIATSNTAAFAITPVPSGDKILWPVSWSIEKVVKSPNNGGRSGGAGVIELIHGSSSFLGFTLLTDLNTDMGIGTRSSANAQSGGGRGFNNYGTRDPRGLPLAVSFSSAAGAFSGIGTLTLAVTVVYYAQTIQNPGVTP